MGGFNKLSGEKVMLKPKNVHADHILFLGLIISSRSLNADPERITHGGVAGPGNQLFLGFNNFNCKIVRTTAKLPHLSRDSTL